MGNGNDQLLLFPPDNGGLPDEPLRRGGLRFGAIKPGDWLHIEHEGKTVVGMIYRRRGESYRFVYWDRMILRFGTTTRDRVGAWDEELTSTFRGQIAVIPKYVEKCIAEWVMQPSPARATRETASVFRGEHPKVQKRLFPE